MTRSILLVFLLISTAICQDRWDSWDKWDDWTEIGESGVFDIQSIQLDSLQTSPDSMQCLITWGRADWDSCFLDTMRTGGSYARMDTVILADSASYNDFNYACVIDSADITYYIRATIRDSVGNMSAGKAANVNIDLSPPAESGGVFNYVFNLLLN